MKEKTKSRIDAFLVLISIYVSGSVLITTTNSQLIISILFLILMVFFLSRRLVFSKTYKKIIIYVFAVSLLQVFSFYFIDYITFTGTIIRFTLPFLIVSLVGKRYIPLFVDLMYFFAIISIVLISLSNIIPGFRDTLALLPQYIGTGNIDEGTNIIIYNVDTAKSIGLFRNSGPLWEPGAYAGYLILALMFNILIDKRLFSKRGVVFIFTIITTISTAGFIALFALIVGYYLRGKQMKYGIFIAPLLAYSFFTFSASMDFMNAKIETELETSNQQGVYTGRIGSAVNDMNDIIKYPFFGRGRNFATRFDDFTGVAEGEFHRTNGLTDFAVKYGLIFWGIYFFYVYKSFLRLTIYYSIDKLWAIYMMIILFIIGSSQMYFQTTLFISFVYLQDVYSTKNTTKLISG